MSSLLTEISLQVTECLSGLQIYCNKCCLAFSLTLSLMFLTLGSLLTALVFSHSSEENNISYLGPSLLAVGAITLVTSTSFLLVRWKQQRNDEINLNILSGRNNTSTFQNVQSFVRTFPFSQPSKESELDRKKFLTPTIPRDGRRLKIKHFRLQHKTPHDLGGSYQSKSVLPTLSSM